MDARGSFRRFRSKEGGKANECTRRTAIEEELEVLYDAYYDELESYANHQVRYASSGYTIAPPPGPGPFPGSVDAAALPSAPAPPPKKPSGIVKTTRDHKNVRPVAKKKPAPTHAHDGPAHGEPGHTHSQSCPHHPHNHHGHATPATTAAKAKGAAVEEQYEEDEEGEEEEEEEYDEDEEEYDEEDEEEEVSFLRVGQSGEGADGVWVVQYDEDEQEQPAQDEVPKKAAVKEKDGGADFFGFGKSLTVKGLSSLSFGESAAADSSSPSPLHLLLSHHQSPPSSLQHNPPPLHLPLSPPRTHARPTASGGILTVADDLLKNDGQKFLEMMEQLADKRIQREREAAESVNDADDDDEGSEDEYDEDEDEDECVLPFCWGGSGGH